MNRLVAFATFFLIALLILGSVHYYFWVRLVRDTALPAPWQRGAEIALWLLLLSQPAGLALSAFVDTKYAKPLVLGCFVWMGMMFLLLTCLLATDVTRLLWRIGQAVATNAPPADPSRRIALSRLFAGVASFAALGLGVRALGLGLGRVTIRNVRVSLSRLPSALSGTTIVQLSDIHIGSTLGRDFIEEIVERTNSLEPDLIAITGDLVDGSVEDLREHVAPLARLKARFGVYFVTGNHEYYSGAVEWCEEIVRLGIRVLRNERVAIGDDQHSFDLAGIDDFSAHRFGNGHGPDLPRALAGRDPDRELVLLAHQPRAIHEAEALGVGLQLSGHTHGGQIWPFNYLVRLQQPVVSGLSRIGRSLIYVSNGTGFWGPPMRLGAPAEITQLTLHSPE